MHGRDDEKEGWEGRMRKKVELPTLLAYNTSARQRRSKSCISARFVSLIVQIDGEVETDQRSSGLS